MLLEFLKSLVVGRQMDYKVGFTTYSFYMREDGVIEVDCTRDGWLSSTIKTIPETIENDMEFLHNLEWS